jgi:hypothetical protein
MTTTIRFAAAVAVVFLSVTVAQAADQALKCEVGKLKTASKYAGCRLSVESKAVKKGEAPDYSKCTGKFSTKWQKLEEKAGPGVCPSEGDENSIGVLIWDLADTVAELLSGMCPVNGGATACDAWFTSECNQCTAGKPSDNVCSNAWFSGCTSSSANDSCAEAINADGCAAACCL